MRLIYIIALTFFTSLSAYQFRGTHFTAQYRGCHPGMLEDRELLFATFYTALKKCECNVLDYCMYSFDNGGFTAVFLLGESHASIHTYPEHGSCFVDFFTCGTESNWKGFDILMQKYLKPLTVSTTVLDRE